MIALHVQDNNGFSIKISLLDNRKIINFINDTSSSRNQSST